MKVPYTRSIEQHIETWLPKKKIIILYGARQVGKTTLSKKILEKHQNSLYINCERHQTKEILESQNPEQIRSFLGDSKLVVFDEAQKVKNIGTSLKVLIDTYPDLQIIATGSSSFDLANEVVEPLTGRNIKFLLYPLSLQELSQKYDHFVLDEKIDQFLRFGMYPDIVESSEEQARIQLDEIASDYLYRDILQFQQMKKPDLLMKLLKALALQLGNEVSYRELSVLLQTSGETIERYIDLLEKSFVIFRLPPFSRNLRKELGSKNKIYFYDLGIRNSLLQNFLPLDSRNDVGALWENFCLVERMKYDQAHKRKVNMYFWRTYDQKEIDYIEEAEGKLNAFEFKWNQKQKVKSPKDFLDAYKNSSFEVISRQNYQSFLLS